MQFYRLFDQREYLHIMKNVKLFASKYRSSGDEKKGFKVF